jgi:hypothetical protein
LQVFKVLFHEFGLVVVEVELALEVVSRRYSLVEVAVLPGMEEEVCL